MVDRYSAKVDINLDLDGYKDLSVPTPTDEDAPPDYDVDVEVIDGKIRLSTQLPKS